MNLDQLWELIEANRQASGNFEDQAIALQNLLEQLTVSITSEPG